MIATAIFKKLKDISDITDLLTVYPLRSTNPAIFVENIPEKAAYPCILIEGYIGGAPWGCRANPGAEVLIDITLYSNKLSNTRRARITAEKIWRAIHRCSLSGYLEGNWESWVVLADAPIRGSDEDGFLTFRVPVRVKICAA